jgi:hypothetical protein
MGCSESKGGGAPVSAVKEAPVPTVEAAVAKPATPPPPAVEMVKPTPPPAAPVAEPVAEPRPTADEPVVEEQPAVEVRRSCAYRSPARVTVEHALFGTHRVPQATNASSSSYSRHDMSPRMEWG